MQSNIIQIATQHGHIFKTIGKILSKGFTHATFFITPVGLILQDVTEDKSLTIEIFLSRDFFTEWLLPKIEGGKEETFKIPFSVSDFKGATDGIDKFENVRLKIKSSNQNHLDIERFNPNNNSVPCTRSFALKFDKELSDVITPSYSGIPPNTVMESKKYAKSAAELAKLSKTSLLKLRAQPSGLFIETTDSSIRYMNCNFGVWHPAMPHTYETYIPANKLAFLTEVSTIRDCSVSFFATVGKPFRMNACLPGNSRISTYITESKPDPKKTSSANLQRLTNNDNSNNNNGILQLTFN